MHSITHSLAQRAPPATRTRVRWQPYNSLPSACSSSTSRSPSSSFLNTPASSVPSSSPRIHTPLCEVDRLRQALPSTVTQPNKEPQVRDSPKNKYALGLVDQAVKSLCEIWRLQDIPPVFLTSSRAMDNVGLANDIHHAIHRQSGRITTQNNQLPSPISPGTRPSPPTSNSQQSKSLVQNTDSKSGLVPIKGFVHEVLRRSRTTGSVLQTALCYLEAIRPKIPELVRQERLGLGNHGELNLDSRIVPATAEELEQEVPLSKAIDSDVTHGLDEMTDTVRISDEDLDSTLASLQSIADDPAQKGNKKPNHSLPPLPPLPSPLLCPRRAFLASLILASKFTQDKCYSNRAWAKLSGLPAREIGRCERALGEALEWRLWVGKAPSQPAAAPNPQRPVARSQSEGCLHTPPAGRSPFLAKSDKLDSLNTFSEEKAHSKSYNLANSVPYKGLRKQKTLPADAFTSSSSIICDNEDFLSSRTDVYMNDVTRYEPFTHTAHQPINPHDPRYQSTAANDTCYAMQTTSDTEMCSQSPSPETPGLSYSPSSTESSSGDRTIQMPMFSDDNMAAIPGTQATIAADCWPWNEVYDMSRGQDGKFRSPVSRLRLGCSVNDKISLFLDQRADFFVSNIDRSPIGRKKDSPNGEPMTSFHRESENHISSQLVFQSSGRRDNIPHMAGLQCLPSGQRLELPKTQQISGEFCQPKLGATGGPKLLPKFSVTKSGAIIGFPSTFSRNQSSLSEVPCPHLWKAEHGTTASDVCGSYA